MRTDSTYDWREIGEQVNRNLCRPYEKMRSNQALFFERTTDDV
jgi:hypothetical protein